MICSNALREMNRLRQLASRSQAQQLTRLANRDGGKEWNDRARLLRCNNPAHRVPSRQHDPSVIDLGLETTRTLQHLSRLAFYQSSAASGAPIALRFVGEHSVTLAAHPFHVSKIIKRNGDDLRNLPVSRTFQGA
jgi:hypothetical protein